MNQKVHSFKKVFILLILFVSGYIIVESQTVYPPEIEQVLKKAKQNRKELEKALANISRNKKNDVIVLKKLSTS